MITIHIVLHFTIFTNDVKRILDEALNDLPFGSHIFVELGECMSPFTDKEKEEQIRTCYQPNANEMLIFEIPKSTSVDVHTRNTTGSEEDSEVTMTEILRHPTSTINSFENISIRAWITDWLMRNHTLLQFLAYERLFNSIR